MSTAFVIDPEYNWKQAAAEEGVDYDAVKKAFMDQAYGFVANKAKVLFQDPFRLGFEIVHRNEKATKMVGIFAFRCNNALLYAPVFFVNGEIKSADMLYRADVKRFVPLTDEWCAFLVRGANQESGSMIDKSRQRQPDAYLDRLSYPQRIKYASADTPESNRMAGFLEKFAQSDIPSDEFESSLVEAFGDDALTKLADHVVFDMLAHCAHDDPAPGLLLPTLIGECGPDALTKLASMLEGNEEAQRFVCENYTQAELTNASGWLTKKAAVDAEDADRPGITITLNPALCKSAAERDKVMNHGYFLQDDRPSELTSVKIDDIENNSIHELTSPCVADIMKGDGSTERAVLLTKAYGMLDDHMSAPYCAPSGPNTGGSGCERPDVIYTPGDKELLELPSYDPIFGTRNDDGPEIAMVEPDKLKTGKVYVMVDMDMLQCSEVFVVTGSSKDGDCRVIEIARSYGGRGKLFYAPGRANCKGNYISDNARFLEVAADVDREKKDVRGIDAKWTKVLMDGPGIDKWIRTCAGTATSTDLEITRKPTGLFDITSKDIAGIKKVASDLGMLEAHLALATDWSMTCNAAGDVLEHMNDADVTRFRLYDHLDKSAFTTKMQNMAPWIKGYDPELNVTLDSPQQQVLQTFTPQRNRQLSRYGDHWDRSGQGEPRDPDDDGLPNDAVMTKSPEELAQMASQYQMPHIFDHGAVGQMANSMFNTVTQIQQYIPDLETGVDRYFRVLFLLRYRPADFEEAYGKDELMEMEQELSELASSTGENLLRMLKRFDLNKYTKQQT